MNKTKLKKTLKPRARFFLLLIVLCIFAFSITKPPLINAQTQQDVVRRAENLAREACQVVDPNHQEGATIDACKERYAAAYLGNSIPDCPDPEGDNTPYEWCQTIIENGGFNVRGSVAQRNQDYPNIANVCSSFISNAEGGGWPNFSNLTGQSKTRAINACKQGFGQGLVYSPGNYPGSATCPANNPLRQACLAGRSLADHYIFTPNVASTVARNGSLPGEGIPPGGGGGGGGADDGSEDPDCDVQLDSPLSWIICPLVDLGTSFTDWVFDTFVRGLLEEIPISTQRGDGGYNAWQSFRILANIILVGALLILVYGMIRGQR